MVDFHHFLLNDFEKLAASEEYIALWNLPCHPDFNGIETCWAQCKQCVRECFFFGRSLDVLKQHLNLGFYGGIFEVLYKEKKRVCSCKGVTASSVQKHILHSYKELQQFGELHFGEEFDLATFWDKTSGVDIKQPLKETVGGTEIPFEESRTDFRMVVAGVEQ